METRYAAMLGVLLLGVALAAVTVSSFRPSTP